MVGIVYARSLPRNRSKRVLIWAHSQVILSYAIRFWNEVRVVNGSWKATVALHSVSGDLEENLRKCCREAGLEVIQPAAVPWRRWDLCLVTDHCFPDTLFDDRVPISFYYHGLCSAKRHQGENYKYSVRNTHDRFGRLKYAAFIEAGPFQAAYAAEANPDLAKVLEVAGDPFIDDFLRLDEERRELRESLGLKSDETLVLIQSTWGESSLDALYGDDLYRQSRELAHERGWHIVLSTHPSQWVDGGVERNRSEYFLGLESPSFKVLRPGEDRLPWLAAADLCISDVTSQSLLFALSGRPLLFVDVPATALDPKAELAVLMSQGPRWDGSYPIGRLIDEVLDSAPNRDRQEFLEALCAYRGASSLRFAEIAQGLIR